VRDAHPLRGWTGGVVRRAEGDGYAAVVSDGRPDSEEES
jgi:hypothetical protein